MMLLEASFARVICFPFLLLCLVSSAEAQTILFDSTEHDFGVLNQGETVSFEFPFKNVGAKPLVIHKLNPSCGCTAAIAESATINPGDRSYVKVTFDSDGFTGIKKKTVRVYSNDPENSSQILLVTADVRAEIHANPSIISLSEIPYGSGAKAKFVLETRADSQAEVQKVFTKSKFIKTEILNNQGSQRFISVEVLPDTPVGKHRTRVSVRTSSSTVPVINVPVFVEVVGPFRFQPKVANFGVVSQGEEKKLNIRLETTSAAHRSRASVGALVSSDPLVKAEVVSSEEQKILVLTLQAKRVGILKGSVRVDFTDAPAEFSSVQIPYFAVIE